MRDLILASTVAWLAFKALSHPWIGIMGWTWISMMNPHRLAWGFAAELPVAAIVGGATLVGLFITKDRRQFFVTPESGCLIAFMLWMSITLPFSMILDPSVEFWKRVMKIDLMILVTLAVLHSRRHIEIFTWVVAGSLAFYGVKGGIFTIAKGGSHKVWGPEDSFIEGNNEIALALIIIIPLLRFIQLTSNHVWVRRGMVASMILCAASALGSHSRGALLALGAMAFVMWMRSENKARMGLILLMAGLVMIPFMPDEWTARMHTIQTYQSDESAMGRINAWWMAWNLATRNFLGGGFYIWTGSIFAIYAPVPDDPHAAHSIYFQVLGEQGFVGFTLFMLIWIFTWFKAGKLRKIGGKDPRTRWLADLGAMCQVSLAGYAVGGAFLSLAYFDLPYNIMIMVVLGARWYEAREWVREPQPVATGATVAGQAA